MNTTCLNKLHDYVKSQSRNRLVFHCHEIPGIVPVNIGLRISEAIYIYQDVAKIPMKVSAEIDRILNAAISCHDVYGKYLSIENIGILFEPQLKFNFTKLLDNYSQNNVLFVQWDGEMDTDNIYFLTKENGIKIQIQDLSHIIL